MVQVVLLTVQKSRGQDFTYRRVPKINEVMVSE